MRRGMTATLALILLTLVVLCGCHATQGASTDTQDDIPARDAQESTLAQGAHQLQTHEVRPTQDNVRLVSRTVEQDGVTWLAQSGSAVEFEVEGTRVELHLAGGDETQNEQDLRPRFAVLLDGEVVLDDTLGDRTRTVEVFGKDTSRSAVVEVMQLSEAKRGVIGVESIVVESERSRPVTPTAGKDLSIAFIGDSITCGYGVESTDIDDTFKTTTENFMKSYAYIAACDLDADYETVCYSGYGIVSGWSADGTRNTNMLLPPLYDVVSEEFTQPWDFSEHGHEVVVINLGTNDSTYTGTVEERMQEFAQGYADFLNTVRDRNPDAHIICTLGTMGADALYPCVEQAVRTFVDATGDERISCYHADPIDALADGFGAGGHPTEASQRKSADRLVETIRQVLE